MKKLNLILHSNFFFLFFVCFALLYSFFSFQKPFVSQFCGKETEFIGTIIDFHIDENKLTLQLQTKEKIIGYYYWKEEGESKNFTTLYHLGDTVLLQGTISPIRNSTIPNTFDYKQYLEYRKIYYQISIDSIILKQENTHWIYKIRNLFQRHLDQYQSKDYLYTFLLGNKDFLQDSIKITYQQLGISHLLAISGMHISLLGGIFLFLFKKVHLPVWLSYFFTISFLIFYMILMGNSVSVMRAVLFFFFLGINKIFQFSFKTLHIWCIVFCILLFQNPYYLLDISFQFSFLISFFLILLQNKLPSSFFISLFFVSGICSLVSLPITIYHFYQINMISIFLNLIFVPFVSFLFYPFCLLTVLFPVLDSILCILIHIMENSASFIYQWKYFLILFGKPPLWWIFLYYLFLLLFFYWKKKWFWGILLLLCFQYYKPTILSKSFVTVLDVGQGDSTFIHLPQSNILIDTGGKLKYYSTNSNWGIYQKIISFLQAMGIKEINYLIVSHGDYDHMGEAINLVNNFKVKNVIFNNDDFNELENELIKILESKKIKYYKGLKELNIGNNKLYFLNTKEYDNENDNSNVLYFKINDHKFLFMGDAGVNREKDILNKYNLENIDFIKIGHHGSNTSSSEYFIDNIKPKNCLISVGAKNHYGHPKESVLDILDDYCDIYRTDLDGSIEIKIDNKGYKIKTYNP